MKQPSLRGDKPPSPTSRAETAGRPSAETPYSHEGGCHCGAIGITLRTTRPPHDQILGACQCGFCRKHNARAFSDPGAGVTLVAHEPALVERYSFGLRTAEAVICRRCGVYVAMLLVEGGRAWSTINIDALEERAAFTRPAEPRDYSAERAAERTARRKARWSPTTLVDWPETIGGVGD